MTDSDSSTKHTPGPWTAHDDDGTGTLPCVLSDKVNKGGNFYVAQCNVYEDAKLIAAAPDLLEALEKIEHELHKAANAGLKFAGKPDRISQHKRLERDLRDDARAAIERATPPTHLKRA